MPELKLGKKPVVEDSRDLLFSRYVKPAKLPKPPDQFGHETLFPRRGWGMLGNDDWGDCAIAGPAHETMLLTKEGQRTAAFTTAGVLSDYSAVTGFDPNAGPPGDNPTDQGSEVRKVLGYRRETGVVDAQGNRHKIGAYVRLDQQNLEQIWQAMYLFQVVGIGIYPFPKSALDQFHDNEPWDVVDGSHEEGGHYVCCVGKRDAIGVVTWGTLQPMTQRFFSKYCDEAWTYISEENLVNGKNLEGFDMEQLRADLAALGT
jgi:hypothetical protein